MKFAFGIALTILLFFLTSPIDAKDSNKKGFCGNRNGHGRQIKSGFCSDTFLGEIPSINNMTSSLIITPKNEATLRPNKNFTVSIKIKNLKTGFFSDPEKQYYAEPQALSGKIVRGHSHITIQRLDSDETVPDAKNFAFFEGLNNAAKNGILTVEVSGLDAGRYRICTMSSSFTHQPLVMPVAKRGSQDD
ncbi:13703_t:CDS:1, partial [Dentiscutata heterogama]